MMSRALKAFPGMVISVLLATPSLAATGSAPHGRSEEHLGPRRSLHASDHRRPAYAAVSRTGGRVTAATRGRRGGRSAAALAGLVNDATDWSAERPYQPAAGARVTQVGTASWYGGREWQGRRMSSGERYDDAQLTAAHATLPLGSHVLVSLPGSARSVVVDDHRPAGDPPADHRPVARGGSGIGNSRPRRSPDSAVAALTFVRAARPLGWVLVVSAMAACGGGFPSREMRYTGTVMPDGACGVASRGTLTTVGGRFTFAPSDGVLLLSGTVGASGELAAALATPGVDRKPFLMRFDGALTAGQVTGRYLTPRCGFNVRLSAV